MSDTAQPTRTTCANGTSATREAAHIEKLAIVVVTFKRQQLLATLFDSFCTLTQAPWRIVIVDNEHSDETARMVADLAERTRALWGTDTSTPDAEGGTERVVYAPQEDNLGGAGGFSAGVKRAWELGAQWFWVMDDDVRVLPDALDKLAPGRVRTASSKARASTLTASRFTGSTTSSTRSASPTPSPPRPLTSGATNP